MLGYLIVVCGGLLILVGGMIATWGWNAISQAQVKKNLLVALNREVQLNGKMIRDAQLLARRWHQRAEHEAFSYQPYRTTQADAVLGSGLFSFQDGNDSRVLEVVNRYRSAVGAFNATLGIVGRYNPGLFIRVEFIHDPDRALPKNDAELYSDKFLQLVNSHRDLKGLLTKLYAHAVEAESALGNCSHLLAA